MQFAALRWAAPAWVKDDAACSKYLLSYLDLMIANGTPVDFIGPGINEADYKPGLGKFIKETFKPALDAGGHKSKIVISDDVDKRWGAAPAINADPALKAAIFAISSHYTDASTPEAKKSGLPLLMDAGLHLGHPRHGGHGEGGIDLGADDGGRAGHGVGAGGVADEELHIGVFFGEDAALRQSETKGVTPFRGRGIRCRFRGSGGNGGQHTRVRLDGHGRGSRSPSEG